MRARSLIAAASLSVVLAGAAPGATRLQSTSQPVEQAVVESDREKAADLAKSNYLGWYIAWSVEGSCVGGEGYGNNPDAMEVWLKGDGVPDQYVTHLSHGTYGNCDDHLAAGINWDQHPLLQNSCDGGPCLQNPAYYQAVQPHQHSSACHH